MAKSVIITCAVTGPSTPLPCRNICPLRRMRWRRTRLGRRSWSVHPSSTRPGSKGRQSNAGSRCLHGVFAADQAPTDAVINITTGGGHGMTLEERCAGALRVSPEMTSLNMGSMTPACSILDKPYDWKHEWEPEYLEMTRDFIRNTFKDIEWVLKELGEGHGVRFEFECYDTGHLNLAHFVDGVWSSHRSLFKRFLVSWEGSEQIETNVHAAHR